jgi:hypothetical protein
MWSPHVNAISSSCESLASQHSRRRHLLLSPGISLSSSLCSHPPAGSRSTRSAEDPTRPRQGPAPARCTALDRSRTEPLDAASRSRAAPSVHFALMELNSSVSTLPHYLHSSSMNAIHGSHEDRPPFPPSGAPLSPSPTSINWTPSSSLLLPYPSSLPPQAPSLSPTRPHRRRSSSTPSPSAPLSVEPRRSTIRAARQSRPFPYPLNPSCSSTFIPAHERIQG